MIIGYRLADLVRIYEGSDGQATQRLYAGLEALGPVGLIAVNLFRASKTSQRAKVYRGGPPGRGSYRSLAYGRKQWSLDNLSRVLAAHAETLGIRWGWKRDPATAHYEWVLYVDLPLDDDRRVQVSFHTAQRGQGPDYAGQWDGQRAAAADRILRWIVAVTARQEASR